MLDTVRIWTPLLMVPALDTDYWETASWSRGDRSSITYRCKVACLAPDLEHCRMFIHTIGSRPQVTIEVSLPRVATGTNVTPLDAAGFQRAVARLNELVASSFLFSDERGSIDIGGRGVRPWSRRLPSVEEWNVSRVDLPFDYRPRGIPFKAAHEALLSLQPTRRLVKILINAETVYFRTKARRKRLEIAIYDKAAEVRSKTGNDLSAKGLIRIEVRLYEAQTVRNAFRTKSAPRLNEVFNAQRVGAVLLAKLALLHVQPGLESVVTGFDALAERLEPERARRLWPYVLARSSMSREQIVKKWKISSETARRYERELRAAGLYPAAVGVVGVLEQVVEQVSSWMRSAADALHPMPDAAVESAG